MLKCQKIFSIGSSRHKIFAMLDRQRQWCSPPHCIAPSTKAVNCAQADNEDMLMGYYSCRKGEYLYQKFSYMMSNTRVKNDK
jgi:hypothetical protein